MIEYSKNCKNCNRKIIYNNKYNLERSIRENSVCRSCNRIVHNKTRGYSKGIKNSQWKSPNEIPYSWFSKYFLRNKNKYKRSGTIDLNYIYDLWIKQDKKCRFTKLPIGFNDDGNGHTCSIDRIDNTKEYTECNIQLVHKDVNLMKNRFKDEYFIEICKLIAENN